MITLKIFRRIDLWFWIRWDSVQSLRHVWLFGPHGLQHTRLPCPSPAPGACSYSCPSSWWCHPIISFSVFPSCLQSFPESGYFSVSQFFASGGQGIGTSASASVIIASMHIQHQCIFRNDFPGDWLVWSPCSPKDSQESSPTAPQFKSSDSLALSPLYAPTLTLVLDYWKNHTSTIWTLLASVMSLPFNIMFSFSIAFLQRS